MAIYRIQHDWPVPADWRTWQDVLEERDAGDAEIAEKAEEADILAPLPEPVEAELAGALEGLKSEILRCDFHVWLRDLRPLGVSAETLILSPAGELGDAWLENHVKRRLEEILKMPVRIEARDG